MARVGTGTGPAGGKKKQEAERAQEAEDTGRAKSADTRPDLRKESERESADAPKAAASDSEGHEPSGMALDRRGQRALEESALASGVSASARRLTAGLLSV